MRIRVGGYFAAFVVNLRLAYPSSGGTRSTFGARLSGGVGTQPELLQDTHAPDTRDEHHDAEEGGSYRIHDRVNCGSSCVPRTSGALID